MKKIAILTVFCVLGLFTHSFAQKKSKPMLHNVVIQMSSGDTLAWKGLMNNLKNLKTLWGNKVNIEVVAHSAGIKMLMTKGTTQAANIEGFAKDGVFFKACENTLRERKITKEEILPLAGFVPSGVGEVILKQEQGWSYLKAGF